MKVSFLVTFYNQRDYVRQSLDSILSIDKPCDWEILIGDDGSADDTVEEINKYIKQYPENISLYVMPRKTGVQYDSVMRASANRLNLLEHSTGDFFCTLDGDDFFCDTSFVKDAINAFSADDSISIVAFGFRYVTGGILGKELSLPTGMINKRVDKRLFLENFYLPAGGCVHKLCYGTDRIEYIKEMGFFDDNNIVINSLNYGDMFAINRPIYAYRQTGQSVFSRMSQLEQAVLNVQGMDVDLRLINDELKDSVKKRYVLAVILMFIWRKKIREILGNEKYKKYENGCKSLKPSYCYDLLHYNEISSNRKKEIKTLLKLQKKYTVTQYGKYCLKGIIK